MAGCPDSTTRHSARVRAFFRWVVNLSTIGRSIVLSGLFPHLSQFGNAVFNGRMGAEPLFEFFGYMRIKGVGKKEVGCRVVGARKRSFVGSDFFQGARQAFG